MYLSAGGRTLREPVSGILLHRYRSSVPRPLVMMLCGRRGKSGVIILWDDMVGEDVAGAKEVTVTGEYPE